jgi:hypothetical protein
MTKTIIGAMIRRDIPPRDVPEHARRIKTGFDELWVVEDLPEPPRGDRGTWRGTRLEPHSQH